MWFKVNNRALGIYLIPKKKKKTISFDKTAFCFIVSKTILDVYSITNN